MPSTSYQASPSNTLSDTPRQVETAVQDMLHMCRSNKNFKTALLVTAARINSAFHSPHTVLPPGPPITIEEPAGVDLRRMTFEESAGGDPMDNEFFTVVGRFRFG